MENLPIGINVVNDSQSFRFLHNGIYINVKIFAKADFPYIELCNEDENRSFVSCVHLFIGEAIKMLKYLNTRFEFTALNILEISQVNENLKSDNIFKAF